MINKQVIMEFDTEIKNDLYERLKDLLEDKEVQEDQEIVDFYLCLLEDYVIEMQGEALYDYSQTLKRWIDTNKNK